jgi:hypothetical protein
VEQVDHGIDDLSQCLRFQDAHLGLHEVMVRCEQLAGSRLARPLQSALAKAPVGQHGRAYIGVRIAGDVAQNPVASSGLCEDHRWA